MSGGVELLRRAVGGVVKRVIVEVLFYSVETVGTIGNVALDLEGRRFYLGCAGNGNIFVVASNKQQQVGSAPGFTQVDRAIVELVGPLTRVESGETSLELTIGGHTLVIRNEDDELSLAVDHEPLSRDVLKR